MTHDSESVKVCVCKNGLDNVGSIMSGRLELQVMISSHGDHDRAGSDAGSNPRHSKN